MLLHMYDMVWPVNRLRCAGSIQRALLVALLWAFVGPPLKAQIPSIKYEYTLKRKSGNFVPEAYVYKDTINLNPFDLAVGNQITVLVVGLEQRYRLDIAVNGADTTAFITAYTYEISAVKPNRHDRRMFPGCRIEKKTMYLLKTKVTPLSDTLIHSVLAIMGQMDFDGLPTYETLGRDIGLAQFDGISFGFSIKSGYRLINYYANRLYLSAHPALKTLKPIDALLTAYFKANPELMVAYEVNKCYRSEGGMNVCQF